MKFPSARDRPSLACREECTTTVSTNAAARYAGAVNRLNGIIPGDLARQSIFQLLTRIGFAARGMLYILIAVLVIGTGRTEGLTGALEYVGDGVGRWMLFFAVGGMAAYGLWRLSEAAFAMESGHDGWKSRRKRAASAGVALIYFYLAYKAARVLIAGDAETASGAEQAETVLDLPGGIVVLAAVAIGIAIGAAFQLRKAVTCSFLEPLDAQAISTQVKWLGRIGYGARAVIILIVGFLIGRAAIDGRSDEVGGMERALDLLSGPWLYAVALGLLLFGLFSLVEARHRRVRQPPADQLLRV